MKPRTKWIAAGAGTLLLLGAGTGVAVAAGGDDSGPDHAITGSALDQASTAALAFTGGGRVTETEVGDEESLYEVEVTLDGGKQVDVQLDAQFKVVSSETDHEDADEVNDGD